MRTLQLPLRVQFGQAVQRGSDIPVVGAERFLTDAECALEQRLGFGLAALDSIQFGQGIERGSDIGGVWAERFLADAECALEERLVERVEVVALLRQGRGREQERPSQ